MGCSNGRHQDLFCMTESEVYQHFTKQSRNGFRVNELIRFSYPVRQVKLEVTVAKRLDRTLERIYRVLLKAIDLGFDTRQSLYGVLGIEPLDGFIQRELFGLHERGLINSTGDKWVVNPAGFEFMKDPSLVMTEEQTELKCFIDGMTGKPFTLAEEELLKQAGPRALSQDPSLPQRLDGDHIGRLFDDLRRIYNRGSDDAVLLGYAPEPIRFQRLVWLDRWVVEYMPVPGEDGVPRIEVFKGGSLERDKRLSDRFNGDYDLLMALTDSDRAEVGAGLMSTGEQEDVLLTTDPGQKRIKKPAAGSSQDQHSVLGIWETKQKFKEALKTAKRRVLIESPWIKRATQEYIPLFEELLKARKEVVILYGIQGKDEHDHQTLSVLNRLADEYADYFLLIHLPRHLSNVKHKMVGSHRKLLIKDSDYFIVGSYNFLSMGQVEGQKVANEQSVLLTDGVDEMWNKVFSEYELPGH